MQKKTETTELDIPADDIDCWNRYPKHRWVYDLSRLLDAQNIKWSPYKTDEFDTRQVNMQMYSVDGLSIDPGFIYTKEITGRQLFTEVYIAKGEIKLMRHIDPVSGEELPTLQGEIELRLNAFVTLYFTKFSGVISVKTHSNDIYGIQLRPYRELGLTTNIDVSKLTKRLYKRSDSSLLGLADRSFHATIAS